MTERDTELPKPLVVGHKRDGRRVYDPKAKRELIEACFRPGVSVARLALEHGINANLLRTWMTRYRHQEPMGRAEPAGVVASAQSASSFIPVVPRARASGDLGLTLNAQLANGVRLQFGELRAQDVAQVLRLLSQLSCSGSTHG